MIQLELPSRLQQAADNARLAAEAFFRPIARKYDRAEHEEPVELQEFSRITAAAVRSRGKDEKPARGAVESASASVNGRSMFTIVSVEQLCWGDVGLMLARPGQGLGNAAIAAVGTDEQKSRWGQKFASMAITEPGAGSDSKNIATSARRDGDHWVLNGEKIYVTDGERCEVVVVWATVDKSLGKGGIKSFLVAKGTPGMEVARLERKLGIRASDTAAINFSDCRIPADHLLGADASGDDGKTGGKGFGGAMQTFDNTRPIVAAMAIGCARAALEMTTELLAERGITADYAGHDSGRSAAAAELLAMEADWEAARLLTLQSAWMMDNRKPNSKEASMAKAKAGRIATDICLQCVALCGLEAYSERQLLEKFARDAKILDIFEGTQQIQQLIVARHLLGKGSQELR